MALLFLCENAFSCALSSANRHSRTKTHTHTVDTHSTRRQIFAIAQCPLQLCFQLNRFMSSKLYPKKSGRHEEYELRTKSYIYILMLFNVICAPQWINAWCMHYVCVCEYMPRTKDSYLWIIMNAFGLRRIIFCIFTMANPHKYTPRLVVRCRGCLVEQAASVSDANKKMTIIMLFLVKSSLSTCEYEF